MRTKKQKKNIKEFKGRELFENLRSTNVGWFNLKTRLTFLVLAEFIVCIFTAFGIAQLINLLFESASRIPFVIQFGVISLVVIGVATRLFSRLFFDPIKQLRDAMQRVADGDFSVRLDTAKSSKEIQEVNSGFNLMMEELSATEILQTDFVSNVSHEFKTPINAIEGYTTLLQDCENLTAEEQEYVDKILFNTKRLSNLVGNILLLSKLDNQSIHQAKTRFRLDEQIRQSVVALESEWDKKDIQLDVDLESIEYTGSENLFHHVWDNIIGNAVKFSPEGGEVVIRLTKKDGLITFSAADRGPGLSEKTEKHLFDKFYQGDPSHKSEGNGLGLALVMRILTICQGEIRAENREGGGSLFTVILTAN